MLFYLLERQLEANVPLIVETPFNPKRHTARFLTLKATYPFFSFQIY